MYFGIEGSIKNKLCNVLCVIVNSYEIFIIKVKPLCSGHSSLTMMYIKWKLAELFLADLIARVL